MLASTEAKKEETIHDELKNRVAADYRAKGYQVTVEKQIGNRRVDIYAENDKECLIIEVVATHYAGPLDTKVIAQLKIKISQGPNFKPKRRTNIFIVDRNLWKWAIQRAKAMGCHSVSEYLFDLAALDEKNDFSEALKTIRQARESGAK